MEGITVGQQQQPTEAELKAKYEAMYQPQQPQQPQPARQDGWLHAVQEGDLTKAQRLLEEDLTKAVKPKVEEEVLKKAADVVRAEIEVQSYVGKAFAETPEVKLLEPYIMGMVERRLAQEAPSIQTVADYVGRFKTVLNEELTKARELHQQLRAAGQKEAMTVRTEVLSSSTGQVSGETDKGAEQPPPAPPTPEEYMAARMSAFRRVRNAI